MNLLSVQNDFAKGITINQMNCRVAYYCRVSTEKGDQLNSLENQKQYFENYIKESENWKLAGAYIDKGKSGTSLKNRVEFNRMIADAKRGKFDLIVTKEASRWARNIVDAISVVRELLQYGVGVIFQNDGICTFDKDAEMYLSIMSTMAQNESRKISTRVAWGHKMAIKNKHVLGKAPFGYVNDDRKLKINPDEAEIVKKLYTMYSTGNYSLKDLERYFYEQGYRNRNGNKLAHNTLGNIICNPKNMGYYVGGKVIIIDMFTKKQRFLPEEEWKIEYAPDIVPPIVDEDTWRKAFDIFKERSDDVKTNRNVCNKDNLLTGKMYCAHCGAPYYKRERGRWVCSYKKEHGKDSCPSLIISEDEIRPILLDVFRETSSASERAIRKMMQAFENMLNDNETEKAIRKYQKDLDKLTERKSKLLDLYLDDGISKADYNFKESEINEKIVEIEKTIKELDQGRLTKEAYADKLNTIRKRLVQAEKDVDSGIITPDFVKHYIDRINVSTEGNIINLEIILFSGIRFNSVIEKNGGRPGTMVKKMIEAYENGMK